MEVLMKKEETYEMPQSMIHHIHHNPEITVNKREVSISTATNTVTLTSDDPKDSIAKLSAKAIELIQQIRGMDHG